MNKLLFSLIFLASIINTQAQTQPEIYHLDPTHLQAHIPSTLWGIFFEDINRGADGGLYAEMIENRSFDFEKPMTGWETWPSKRIRDGIFMIINQSAENPDNPKYLHVTLKPTDTVGLLNAGFEGLSFQKGQNYTLTLRFKRELTGTNIRIFVYNGKNRIIAKAGLEPQTDLQPQTISESNKANWQEQTITITPNDTTTKGKLLIIFEGGGTIDIDRISLFPNNTWKNRPGGLRTDLAQKIYDLHPGFMRFPGGCIVEGKDIAHRYQWKKTIGPLHDRRLIQSIWADDVPNRPTPDYFESFGLGFYEYFQFCEDIGAAPMPILNCGLSCQFDAAEVVPVNDLGPYIRDALDLIEFANGDVNTKWGAKRAELGHPAPFHMKMMGVGNENWGPQYIEHLQIFSKAIKEKYPDMQLICATGYSPNPQFHYMDSALRAMHVDIIDEHYYMSPDWFFKNSSKYDHYDRTGPKIFVGEYAAQSVGIGSPDNKNTLRCALGEAAFMTGLERNADVVSMASYAPLLSDVRDWQWTPDLIWFDNSRVYATPSYYVQQLFSLNKGTDVIPILLNGQTIQGQDSVWASAVVDKKSNDLIIKLVNGSSSAKDKEMEGFKNAATGTQTILSGNPEAVNSLDAPDAIKPITQEIKVNNKKLELHLPPYSFNVIRVHL